MKPSLLRSRLPALMLTLLAPTLLSAQLVSAAAAATPAVSTTVTTAAAPSATAAAAGQSRGLTEVDGLKVGHAIMSGRPTGCTVVLAGDGVVGSVDVRGGAPATRETDLLSPVNLVQVVHAVALSGGSAFGLDTASGVMRYLEGQGIGFDTRVARVPIVPGASLFDLAFGGDARIRPDADCGWRAAQAASAGPVPEGNVGAGAGATVGKLAGMERAMKAGIGSSAIRLPNGLVVAALVAVNAVGDIIDPATGRVLAGVRTADGKDFADARRLLREPPAPPTSSAGSSGPAGATVPLPANKPGAQQNTTIAVVATNARLTKTQAAKVAQMAHDGYARAIQPVHTPFDGDAIFALATGRLEGEINLLTLGALAADAMAEAIVRAATQAEGAGGLPAARDLVR